MNSIRKYTAASFIILIAFIFPVKAQVPNTMYFMPGVPQSNRINPSIQPGCGFYLGLPGVAPLRLQVSSSSLDYNDIIYYNSDIDSLITPFHPLGDKKAFLDNMQDVNYFLSSLGTSIASFGFRANKSFFSFDITTRVDGNIYYPKGFFNLIFDGLAEGGTISFGGLGVDINAFNEFAMGWSRKDFFLTGLDIGIRGKALFGLANVNTKSSVFDLTTSMDSWILNTEMQINAAAPAAIVTFSDDINNDPVVVHDEFFNSPPMDIVSEAFSLNQFGLALDVGASYRPFQELLLSASIMDIGGINWKNTQEGSLDFEYEFTGIELNPFSDEEITLLDDLQDSILSPYSFSLTPGNPYFSRLNTKLFIGASYYPIEKIGFGLLSRTDFLNQKISQQITGSVNMTTGKFANLSLSYSYMSQSFNNIGAGLSFNVGPLNMYLISDNIINIALNPTKSRAANLWFGMNLTFGWKRAEKKTKQLDKPLVI